MPISAAILAQYEALNRTAADLEKRTAKLDAEVQKREGKLKEAFDSQDATVIETQLKALKGDIAETTTLLHDADVAMQPLTALQNDEAFMQERDDDADRLSKIIAATRHKTAQHYKTLKKWENDAEEAWRKSLKSEDFALRRLAELDDGVKDLRKNLKERFEKLDKAAQRAYAAQEARDAKALATAKAAVEAIHGSDAKLEFETYQKLLAQFKADIDADKEYTADLRATLTDGIKDLSGEMKSMSIYVEQCVKTDEDVKELKIEAIDIDKALKALELDSKHKAKLAKALSGPPSSYEKALTALAKELKLDADGKALLAKLKKAGVI